MVLYYYKGNNFGDSLNPFIFQRLLPNLFDGNEDELFVGIGSLLGFPDILKAKKKIIFSTGFAKGKISEYGRKPKIDHSFDIKCVRGPLTARVLGIDPKLAITDGAALVRALNLSLPAAGKNNHLFIPHKATEYKFNWEPVCRKSGIDYASPHEKVEDILAKIQGAKIVLAESLHAAIVADAFRIPWIPVKTFYSINRFKWLDWTASLHMPYKPVYLFPLISETRLSELIRQKTGSLLNGSGSVISKGYAWAQENLIVDRLLARMDRLKRIPGFLSEEKAINEKTDQLMEKISELK